MEKPKLAFEYDASQRNSELHTKFAEQFTEETKLIKEFGSYTTLHGFHFIFDSGTSHRRIFWFLLMILGFGCLAAQVFYNISRLNSNETRIQKSVELSESLDFPAVTICNQNMLKKSKIMGTQAQDYLDQMDHLKLISAGLKHKNVSPFDIDKVVEESGHQTREMINDCSFNDGHCSSKNFTRAPTTSFLHGNCYTFNAGDNGSSNLRVTASGRMQSLILRLDCEREEYYGPFSYEATGFKIAVHQQGRHIHIEEEGYDISPGFYTSIRIKKHKEKFLPPPYHSMCGSRDLLNYNIYTQDSCRQECISKILAKECNCRVLSMVKKGLNLTRYCSSDEVKDCIYPAYRKSIQSIDKSLCDCPQECESVWYRVQLSAAYYPSEHMWDALLPFMYKLTGLNASIPKEREQLQLFVRKRFALVSIFFETLDTDVVVESPSYTLTNFWSDIGGNMGLFLGCSMLTICEFIDLMFMIFLHKWRKAKKQMPRSELSTNQLTF